MPDIDYSKLADALVDSTFRKREKAVSSTPTTVYGHGPGGLFSTPGLSRPLFSAMMLPRMGLQSRLPVRPTVETNPLFGIITGVTASTGDNPSGVCDDPKTVGTMKLCVHSFPLGRWALQTRVFDLDRFGQIVNRGEFTDFQVFGSPFDGAGANPNVPTDPAARMQQAVMYEINKALFEFGVGWSRDFAKLLYTGTTTNNTAGGGYKEFYGLDTLINTGYRDAETGILCPAADSIVRSFSNVDVATPAGAAAIFNEIRFVYRNLKLIASKTGLDPVKWVLAMPFSLFYQLVDIWPIQTNTVGASVVPTGSSIYLDGPTMLARRQEMLGNLSDYSGQFLWIDGQKVDVVIDDAISETQNAGASFTASIYFVPMVVMGATPVTYMEYFNYEAPGGALEGAKFLAPGDTYYTTDNGRFFWHKKPPTNFCVQLLAKTEPRLLLLTPYLAARITDIDYTPLQHERSWDPSNTSYWVDGGRTTGPGVNPSYTVAPG